MGAALIVKEGLVGRCVKLEHGVEAGGRGMFEDKVRIGRSSKSIVALASLIRQRPGLKDRALPQDIK